jgi:DNA invertase Pin-like site-specific DNA recombinase
MKLSAKQTNKTLAYIRVSTGKQDLSLEVQRERIQPYCQMMGLNLVEVITERAVSAKIKLAKRPEGSKIAHMIKDGTYHIVALKLDRLFRNAADALTNVEQWDEGGISLHLVDMGGQSINTGSSMGKMVITMLAGFAEMERNLISERTTAALQFKRTSGHVYNHVPYGFEGVDGTLVPHAGEQSVIKRMAGLKASGMSYARVADELNAGSVPTKQGGIWRSQTVKNILLAAV